MMQRRMTEVLIESIYLSALIRVYRAVRIGMKISIKGKSTMNTQTPIVNKPTPAFVGASWGALCVGIVCYLAGLWNASIQFNEKGYYLSVFLLALFAAVSLQKTVRDRIEGIPVTNIFVGICWFAFAASIAMLLIGLFNADMLLSEKGFYGVSFLMSLFAVITVQKNIRDMGVSDGAVDDALLPDIDDGLDIAVDTAAVLGS